MGSDRVVIALVNEDHTISILYAHPLVTVHVWAVDFTENIRREFVRCDGAECEVYFEKWWREQGRLGYLLRSLKREVDTRRNKDKQAGLIGR